MPTWHTRELLSTLKSLYPVANVTYEVLLHRLLETQGSIRLKEDPGQRHWYDSVFDNEVVQNFIRRHTIKPTAKFAGGCNFGEVFTLTVAVPAESDTLCGLRIEKLYIPGRYEYSGVEGFRIALTTRARCLRLGKLRVTKSGHDTVEIDPINVRQFTLNLGNNSPRIIGLEDQVVNVENGGTFARFSKDKENLWQAR